MKRIIGYVLNKETNRGIPNLLVKVIDSDRQMIDIIAEHKKENSFPPQFIESLGNNMGTVLTDHDGKFIFTSEDLEFGGNEIRPDLLLVVHAPEDSLAIDKPYALSPEQRILHITRTSRTNAGAEEAYIIRILKKQLLFFEISSDEVNVENKAEANSQKYYSSIADTILFREKIQEKLKLHAKKEDERNKSLKEKASLVFKNFSIVPPHLIDHPLFIQDKKELLDKQNNVIKEGLDRLRKYEGEFQLNLSEAEISTLKLEMNRNGQIKGELSSIDIWDLMKKKFEAAGGIDLIRKDVINDTAIRQLINKYLITNESAKKINK